MSGDGDRALRAHGEPGLPALTRAAHEHRSALLPRCCGEQGNSCAVCTAPVGCVYLFPIDSDCAVSFADKITPHCGPL
ncbi:hypothetical protein PLANTIT3_110027 [Plantibacter sp. T3]|nr:hypothetical protein PLANTIT3_110027 [Plantibacter sp. T3]